MRRSTALVKAVHTRLRAMRAAVLLLAVLTACSPAIHRDVGDDLNTAGRTDYGPAPAFSLPNVAGGSFRLAREAASHRTVVLTFVTADCQEECPKVEAVLLSAARTLAHRGSLGRSVDIVTVELDPQTNSLAAVSALRSRLWPQQGWDFLRGSPRQTAAVTHAYDVYVSPRVPGHDLVHSSYVYVVNDHLRQVELLALDVNLTPAKLLRAIAKSSTKPSLRLSYGRGGA